MANTYEIYCTSCGWSDGEHSPECPSRPQEPACPECGKALDYTPQHVFGDQNLGISSDRWNCECGFYTTDINEVRQ